jgi:hypothetical protein
MNSPDQIPRSINTPDADARHRHRVHTSYKATEPPCIVLYCIEIPEMYGMCRGKRLRNFPGLDSRLPMLLGTTRRYFVASGPGQRFLAVTRTPAKCASRCFSISTPRRALTTELSDEEVSELRVNQDRLMKNLHHSCQWGTGVKWGT